jgi:thioredoxin 1
LEKIRKKMTNLVTLTKDNFKKTIEENPFVIVDFWAPWCDPCVAFTPVFEAAAKKKY